MMRKVGAKRLLRAVKAARLLVEHRLMMNSGQSDKNSRHIEAGVRWLVYAQDATADNGVSKGFALNRGWLPSYVETTGYIIPTMFDCSQRLGRADYFDRAVEMAGWELSQQLQSGAFPGCETEANGKPLVFDTGMVLFGLVRAYRETENEDYKKAAERAGGWLSKVQNSSGAWEGFTLGGRPRAYHMRVAWALLELSDISEREEYSTAAIRNLEWGLRYQRANGWFESNTFYGESKALTHTIAYAARGLLESGVLLREDRYIEAARQTADRLCALQSSHGSLPGRFGSNWEPDSYFTCLSANAQVAIIWLRLFELTSEVKYINATNRAVNFLKKTQDLSSRVKGIRGGIRSCDPIYRGYMKLFYSNWAVKFFIDLLLRQENAKSAAGRQVNIDDDEAKSDTDDI